MEITPAILIRRRVWGDTSWIVTWLTLRHGKIATMARGARRPRSPFAGRLDLFYIDEISYALSQKSALHALREIQILEPFDASRISSTNIFLCGYFAELADMATEPGTPVPEIFDLLRRAFAHLKSKPATLRALEHFERELGRLLGISDASSPPLSALESHGGRIPASRAALLRLLANPEKSRQPTLPTPAFQPPS